MNSARINDLGLAAETGSGCSCCATAESAPQTEVSADSVSMDVLVEGMTCGHCVASVTEEISAIEGVEGIDVELNVGGASKVSIASSTPIDTDRIRAAVEGAGYALTGDRS